MLWIRCCQLRQLQLHEHETSGHRQAAILGNNWHRVAALQTALWLCPAIQKAFCRWPRGRLRLRRRLFLSSLGDGPSDVIVFHGATPSATDLRSHPEMLAAGPKINSIVWTCLSLPLVMSARSFCSYVNAYYMAWVSNKVVTDIRTELFSKIAHHSMDFFNRMQAGFLISRITNDTRGMQAALSSVSSDLFKQPVTIIGGIAVLLYMDWKFTLVTLIL